VVAAATELGAHEMIERLGKGYDTEVSERGESLSLGQRQMICFTRAMLADPRIFILDEATSSVDPQAELRIQEALNRLLQDRTSFVIAHRLSTIRHADQVLFIDGGRIVERGTHEELLAHRGRYHGLYQEFIRTE
jgi:ATP-binding cassette subfamily B protein